MSFRIIEVISEDKIPESLYKALKQLKGIDFWKVRDEVNQVTKLSILAPLEKNQAVLERLQAQISEKDGTRIVILPVEGTFPTIDSNDEEEGASAEQAEKSSFFKKGISQEELYYDVVTGVHLDGNFIILVLLSTIVATLGLLENSVAILIGAMLIAPLLGPNLALALATTLGDFKLMLRAIKINLVGVGTSVVFSFMIGFMWEYGFHDYPFHIHSQVGYDSIVLALASGAAAVISLIAGASSILVGVMVAVALLPPAVTIGIMLSAQNYSQALVASLLLGVNIVCINLSANIVFLLKGVQPSKWYAKQKAKRIKFWLITFWMMMLLFLAVAIRFWHILKAST